MDKIGKRIKKIRTQLGLTQKQMAKILGLSSFVTISRWERGERTPDQEALNRLVKLLNVNLNWLLTGEGEMFVKQEGKDELLDQFLQELERIRRDYGEEHYQRALKLAKKLLQDIQTFSESSAKKKAN